MRLAPLGKVIPFLKCEDPLKKLHNPLHWILESNISKENHGPSLRSLGFKITPLPLSHPTYLNQWV